MPVVTLATFSIISAENALQCQERTPSQSSGLTSSAGETLKPESQTSLEEAFAQGTTCDRKSKQWNDIMDTITIHVCKDMVLIKTAERDRAMIKILDSRLV